MRSPPTHWIDVVFPHPPLHSFTYRVPEFLLEKLQLGHRVLVPLGSRHLTGFVVDFVPKPAIEDLRDIEDILDPYPLLTPDLLKLTRWISDYTLSPWGEVIRTALPPGIHRRSRCIVHRGKGNHALPELLSEIQRRLLSLVEDKRKLSLSQLEKKIGKKGLRIDINKLEDLGLVRVEHVLEEAKVRIQSEKWVSVSNPIDVESLKILERKAPRQAYALKKLIKQGGESPRRDLEVDFSVLRKLEKAEWIEIWEEEIFREPLFNQKNETKKSIGVFLLHGVTSSGKTQVYIESIREVLESGRTALVLIPEISLTPQAVQRYRRAFGEEVAVLHSRMSTGERYDSWRRIREGTFRIALGPRSAVFAPLENLGIVIVDEEHDMSYKQMDPAPRYHARDTAVVRGQLSRCTVLLGSATPSLESYFNCETGKYTLCRLTHRIDHVPMPTVTLVDLKQPPSQQNGPDSSPKQESAGNSGVTEPARSDTVVMTNGQGAAYDHRKSGEHLFLSSHLESKIRERLDKGEQVILLQNRRGFAPSIRCMACGTIEGCPHCNISLTYHQKDHRLRCHYCGFQKTAMDICPGCGGTALRYQGAGTQRIEEEIVRLFPQARLYRMDQDTTKRKGSHHRIITDFEQGKADILLGTQMIAKGHDFPGVSLVGIISADTGLFFPDFRSGEKTFQLLTQAAGRAGRRNIRGEVVIQTYCSDHAVLSFARDHDYIGFYKWEIQHRKELLYPPWGKLALLRFKGVRESRVADAAGRFKEFIKPDVSFEKLGPAPSPLTRIKNMFRYQIILRSDKNRDPGGRKLRKAIREAFLIFRERTRFYDIRIGIDMDPMDMM
jgi:primosomal protein N' (replication factor Y)